MGAVSPPPESRRPRRVRPPARLSPSETSRVRRRVRSPSGDPPPGGSAGHQPSSSSQRGRNPNGRRNPVQGREPLPRSSPASGGGAGAGAAGSLPGVGDGRPAQRGRDRSHATCGAAHQQVVEERRPQVEEMPGTPACLQRPLVDRSEQMSAPSMDPAGVQNTCASQVPRQSEVSQMADGRQDAGASAAGFTAPGQLGENPWGSLISMFSAHGGSGLGGGQGELVGGLGQFLGGLAGLVAGLGNAGRAPLQAWGVVLVELWGRLRLRLEGRMGVRHGLVGQFLCRRRRGLRMWGRRWEIQHRARCMYVLRGRWEPI